jgi:hypothetical protein
MGVKSFLKGLNVKAYVEESSCIKALLFQMKLNLFNKFIFWKFQCKKIVGIIWTRFLWSTYMGLNTGMWAKDME